MRGEIKTTKDDFGQRGMDGFVSFRVLESLDCTGAEAYKHMLAWGHFFEENGWALIMAPKSAAACDEFLPETEEIYKKVCAPVTMEDIWYREVPIKKETKQIEEIPLKQINIRLQEDVIEWFRDFCHEERLTQSEGLHQLLLSRQEQLNSKKEDMFVRQLRRKNREIEELKGENRRLKQLRKEKGIAVRQRRDNWIEMIRQMLEFVVDAKERDNCSQYEAVPEYRYRKIKEKIPLSTYLYPERSGSCIIKIEMFVRGDGKRAPLFVLGNTLEGTKIKLRWYPKEDAVGVSPRSVKYAYAGAEWLVGYLQAKDGAMDLLAIVPLECTKMKATFANYTAERKASKLDLIIRDAAKRLAGTIIK